MYQSLASQFFEPDHDGPAVAASAVPSRFSRRSASVDELIARIRRYNAGLDPKSETFGAALVLVAGCEYGQNVELLARRTGLQRAFVARCARRLIDNGIWVGGATVAEWAPRDPASGTFWNDVAVAEGKMCRRTRDDGSLEWAPAGFWNKNFHFLDPDAESRLGNLYFDSAPQGLADPPGDDAATEDESPVEEPHDDAGYSFDPAAEPDVAIAASHELEPRTAPTPAREDVPPLHHIFRDAVWLG